MSDYWQKRRQRLAHNYPANSVGAIRMDIVGEYMIQDKAKERRHGRHVLGKKEFRSRLLQDLKRR